MTSVAPATVAHGAGNTAITVTGSNFVSGAVIRAGTTDLGTTFTNSTSLGATLPSAMLATAKTIPIYVRNPDNQTSLNANFTVT
jgi:hypothetical protein